MATDTFAFVEQDVTPSSSVYDDMTEGVRIRDSLREHYPGHIITIVPEANISLMRFAAAGHAVARLDETETILGTRGYSRLPGKGQGTMLSALTFAKVFYRVKDQDFIVYLILNTQDYTIHSREQYILKKPEADETPNSPTSRMTDALLAAIGEWSRPPPATNDLIYVYDEGLIGSTEMFKQVDQSSWDDVILGSDMKEALVSIVEKFFNSKGVYEQLGVGWYRGLIFAGSPGNGKTISIKAIMNTLRYRDNPVPCIYVKAASVINSIREVFNFARQMAPCLLVLEDIETIVNAGTRSYFFNELDGLEDNSGLLLIATTNHLNQLDPGLSKRPSRFDRKYIFPRPALAERTQYCNFWRHRLLDSSSAIDFPEELCEHMAELTDGFSFAYMKELFLSTLLAAAQNRMDGATGAAVSSGRTNSGDRSSWLEVYELWREMCRQQKQLREDMEQAAAEEDEDGDGENPTKKNMGYRPYPLHGWAPPPPPPPRHYHFAREKRLDVIRLDNGTMAMLPLRGAAAKAKKRLSGATTADAADGGAWEKIEECSAQDIPEARMPRVLNDGTGAPPLAFDDGEGINGFDNHHGRTTRNCGSDWGLAWPEAVFRPLAAHDQDSPNRVRGAEYFAV